jgi:hypothetical protein
MLTVLARSGATRLAALARLYRGKPPGANRIASDVDITNYRIFCVAGRDREA